MTEHAGETFLRLHPQYLLLPHEKYDTFPLNFREIVSGRLAASYYSGTWAKMLATDAFSAVRENGLENRDTHALWLTYWLFTLGQWPFRPGSKGHALRNFAPIYYLQISGL